jgi:hypothetical protein
MRVNLLTFIGAALIVLGIVGFAYRGIPYHGKETITDAASLRTSLDRRKLIPMSPLVIGLIFASGAVSLAVGSAKSS